MNFEINENEIDLYMDTQRSELGGYVQFEVENKTLYLNHTVVLEKYRGLGFGKLLMEETIRYAEENGLKIKPICSYAIVYFEKNHISF